MSVGRNVEIPDAEVIERVAELSRLELTPDELEQSARELERILEYFSRLSAVETENIEPACDPHDFVNHLRDDLPESSFEREALTGLTEHNKDGYFRVPRAIE